MNLNIYTDYNKFNMHLEEYKMIWEKDGTRIINSFEICVLHILKPL